MKLQLAVLVACLGLMTAASAVDNPASKLKVLVVTGGHAFEKEPFFKVFEDNPEITFTAATQGKSSEVYDRDDLYSYQAVVLYDMVQNITDAQKTRFLGLFDKGIGLLVTHHALCSYQDWPEFERIIGGKYYSKDATVDGKPWPKSGFQHDEEVPIIVLPTQHPITAGMSDFTIHDEIYWGFRVQPGATPLLTTSHPKSGKPLAWYRQQGQSKVVYLQLGHDHQAYENPNYRQLLARSIRWVATR